MTDILNFFINNRDNWLPLVLVSAIVTAVLSFHYFFIYSYIINRRLKSPEKKYRLKLLIPRFACIIFAVISVVGTAKLLPGLWWQLNYSYVQSAPDAETQEEYTYTRGQLDRNSDFKLYTARSDNFEYSLYRNENFNGIIDMRFGKNHEYFVFIKYIGSDKNFKNGDIVDCIATNYNADGTGEVRGGGGGSKLKDELCLFGSSSHTDTLGIELSVYKHKDYMKQYLSDNPGSFDLEEHCLMTEDVQFDLKSNKFTKPTRLYGENVRVAEGKSITIE